MTKRGTLAEWIELGRLTKEICRETLKIYLVASKIMTKHDLGALSKSWEHLLEFKDHAETVMWVQLDGEGGGASFNIFYGDKELSAEKSFKEGLNGSQEMVSK